MDHATTLRYHRNGVNRVFDISNEGTQPIREYAVKFFLPAQVARHLRYHNPSDAVQDEVLPFQGPLLWDHVASYAVQSPLNGMSVPIWQCSSILCLWHFQNWTNLVTANK
jgi:hypothetical protein